MPEEKQDPANTQMFRAFVERGDVEKDTKRTRTAFLVTAAVVVLALLVVLIVVAVS